MHSTVISTPHEEGGSSLRGVKNKNHQFILLSVLPCSGILKKGTFDSKRLKHSIKVGIALVLVSLLYLVDPLYEQVGENAMWAIMTVVVVFEFTAGAMLSKGLNRGIGTILGGGLGCLAATLAKEIGGIGRAISVGICVFIFGAGASYARLISRIKKKYDYGVMIFLLTFNLVVVSGHRSEEIIQLARERLSTITMGFVICIFTSLLIFPEWASDELHCSIAIKFHNLANSIERSVKECFKTTDEKKENQEAGGFDSYASVLNSKSKDEILANFARWEPWHGKFGLAYPWDKYLEIGESLRELDALTLPLKELKLLSPLQTLLTPLQKSLKEPSEAVTLLIASTMRELGDSIMTMTRCRSAQSISLKLQSKHKELFAAVSASKQESQETIDDLEMANLVFVLLHMTVKVENLAREVEKLGDLAGFLAEISL